MIGKPPTTIITDQDPWLTDAIAREMPFTKHIFCIWHITSKFSGWFCTILQSNYQDWCADFFKMYKLTSSEEFEHEWPLVVEKYNLVNNKHVRGLYDIRKFWAPVYLRDYFFGGMTTTSRLESINALIKKFVSSHTSLKDFAKQVSILSYLIPSPYPLPMPIVLFYFIVFHFHCQLPFLKMLDMYWVYFFLLDQYLMHQLLIFP